MRREEFQSLDIEQVAKRLDIGLSGLSADLTSDPVALVMHAQKCVEKKALAWLHREFGNKKKTPKKGGEIKLYEEDVRLLKLAQDYADGIGYYTISAYAKKEGKIFEYPFVVTSQRECFPCTRDALYERGLHYDKIPAPRVRWSRKALRNFLDGSEKPLSIPECYALILTNVQHLLDFGDEDMSCCIALWILTTYCYRLFGSYPYLHLNGERECGKTKTLTLIKILAFNGELFSSYTSAAALLRTVDADCSTCCIDEVEGLYKANDDEMRSVQAVLNTGYKKGGGDRKCEKRVVGRTEEWVPVFYDGYCPKVLAGIKSINPTLASRCISIIMVRSAKTEIRNREIDDEDAEWQNIRDSLYSTMLTSFGLIQQRAATMKSTDITGREWELWKPLLTLANIIDPALEQRMRTLAMRLKESRSEMDTATPSFLRALLRILESDEESEEYYSNDDLFERLAKEDSETFGWLADEKSKANRGRWLGDQLRRTGVVKGSSELRSIGGKKCRGYVLNTERIRSLLSAYADTGVTEELETAPEKEEFE